MVLSIKPNWKSFEDYLADLRTKFRTRVKKTFEKSSDVVIKDSLQNDFIIEEYKSTKTEADFLKVCKKIDKTADLTDSKKRKHTYSSVKLSLKFPVETENK